MPFWRVLIMCFVASSLLFACGGESSPEPDSQIEAPAADDAIEDATDAADSEVPGAFDNAECREVAQSMAAAVGVGGTGKDFDFQEAIDGIRKAGEVAPDDVRADFEVFADALDEFWSILDDAGVDLADPQSFSSPAAQKAVAKAAKVMEAPEVQQAQQNIDKKMTELCGTG